MKKIQKSLDFKIVKILNSDIFDSKLDKAGERTKKVEVSKKLLRIKHSGKARIRTGKRHTANSEKF